MVSDKDVMYKIRHQSTGAQIGVGGRHPGDLQFFPASLSKKCLNKLQLSDSLLSLKRGCKQLCRVSLSEIRFDISIIMKNR